MTVLQALDRSTVQEETSYSPEKELRVTEAEYWQKYYNYPNVVYEWHNGYLEERPASDYTTLLMYQFFYELLGHYLKTRPIAKTVVLAMGFRLTFAKEIAIRRPDLAVVLNDNPMPILPGDKSYKGTYDVCIEAVSNFPKQDTERDTVSKKREYAKGGVREYYLLDGHDCHTQLLAEQEKQAYLAVETENARMKALLAGKTKTG